jgi:long-chain acyl-CoA synthetase
VEEILAIHPGVVAAAVVGRPHDFFGEEVVAVVVPSVGVVSETLVAELRVYCREHLSGQAVPTDFFVVTELPRNENGKIQKQVLRELVRG